MKNKILKLIICCISSVIIQFLFSYKNFSKSDFIFAAILGVLIWGLLALQKKT
jgi:peptidoglycan biosynthesis protein MviN/MurJ (putative lipid II flippase)